MPLAITLRIDPSAAAAIAGMQAASGVVPYHPSYPPHVTLAVMQDEALAPAALAAVGALAAGPPLPVSLCAVGLFPGPDANDPGDVLFLAPAPTAGLLNLHAAAVASLPAAALHPHYRAGSWMPHVTLTERIARPAAALGVLDLASLPIAAMLDRLELVRFRPVTVLASRPLAGG